MLIALLIMMFLGLALAARLGKNRRGLYRLANTAPTLSVSPYDPNGPTHKGARLSRTADAAITVRWSLVTLGATPATTIKSNLATTTPIGVIDDTTDTLNSDLTIQVHYRAFVGSGETLKVAVNSTVTAGDKLIPDTSNPIYGMTDPGNNLNRFGIALTSGVAGGVVEFLPFPPSRTAAGIATAAASSVNDAITVPGLVVGDVPIVSLNTIAGSELYVKSAIAAAGQINIVLNAAATSGTTKYNWAVHRA